MSTTAGAFSVVPSGKGNVRNSSRALSSTGALLGSAPAEGAGMLIVASKLLIFPGSRRTPLSGPRMGRPTSGTASSVRRDTSIVVEKNGMNGPFMTWATPPNGSMMPKKAIGRLTFTFSLPFNSVTLPDLSSNSTA